jgi:tetratricopeptide (TPR) repeat protein
VNRVLQTGSVVLILFLCVHTTSAVDFSDAHKQCAALMETMESPKEIRSCLTTLAGYLNLLDADDINADSISSLIKSAPKNLQTAYVRAAYGSYQLRLGNPEKSTEIFLELILSFPADPNILRYRTILAEAFRLSGDLDQAAAQLEPLLMVKTPESAWVFLEKARLCQAEDNAEEALRYYRRIEVRAPGSKVADIALKESRYIRLNQWAR